MDPPLGETDPTGLWRLPLVIGAVGFAVMAATGWMPSYWTDEAATIAAAGRPLGELVRMLGHIDAVHGFYYLLMHLWISVAGISEFALRLPSALFYALAAYATVGLTQLLTRSTLSQIAAGLVFLSLPGLSWVGMEARPFALATALVSINMLSFLGLYGAGRGVGRTYRLLYPVTLPLMFAAEIYTLLLVPVQLLGVLKVKPEKRGEWLRSALPGSVIGTALALFAAGQTEALTASQSLGPRLLSAVWGTFFLGPRDGSHRLVIAYLGSAVGALIIYLVVVRDLLVRRDPRTMLLIGWAVFPLGVVLVLSLAEPKLFSEHYFAFSAPALAVLVGHSLAFGDRIRARAGLVCLALVVFLPMQVTQRAPAAKAGDDYRALAATVRVERPQAVWFDVPSARGVAIAYPDDFSSVQDVRVLEPPQASDTLWGTSLGEAGSRRALEALAPERLLVVYGRAGLASSSGAAAAHALGCGETRNVSAARYSFQYYRCRIG